MFGEMQAYRCSNVVAKLLLSCFPSVCFLRRRLYSGFAFSLLYALAEYEVVKFMSEVTLSAFIVPMCGMNVIHTREC